MCVATVKTNLSRMCGIYKYLILLNYLLSRRCVLEFAAG